MEDEKFVEPFVKIEPKVKSSKASKAKEVAVDEEVKPKEA